MSSTGVSFSSGANMVPLHVFLNWSMEDDTGWLPIDVIEDKSLLSCVVEAAISSVPSRRSRALGLEVCNRFSTFSLRRNGHIDDREVEVDERIL